MQKRGEIVFLAATVPEKLHFIFVPFDGVESVTTHVIAAGDGYIVTEIDYFRYIQIGHR